MEETPEEFAARAAALRSRIQSHPGRIAATRWDSIRMVHASLKWNESFLLQHIDFSGPEGQARAMSYMGVDPDRRQRMQTFWMFLFLHLANFTSMNSTLIDHVRGLLANYKTTPFANEEEKRRQALGYAPVTVFVKDLRNYVSHVTTPPLSFEMSFKDGEEMKFVAKITTAPLLASKQFSANGRRYFADLDDIVIADAVTEYAELREQYYDWLFEQFDTLHGEDVKAHDLLIVEQNEMYGNVSVPDHEVED